MRHIKARRQPTRTDLICINTPAPPAVILARESFSRRALSPGLFGALKFAAGHKRGMLVSDTDDGLSEEQVEAALKETPRGAFALAGLTVGLLVAAWVAIYLFVFLPRGSVG